jgi:hypothetical protein
MLPSIGCLVASKQFLGKTALLTVVSENETVLEVCRQCYLFMSKSELPNVNLSKDTFSE